MSRKITTGASSAYIDLESAKDGSVEPHLYGSDENAYILHLQKIPKPAIFTKIAITLERGQGTADFGQEWSSVVNRSGDYLQSIWIRTTIPKVTLLAGNQHGANGRLSWTKNLMHNLIQQCSIKFNDLEVHKFDSNYIDAWRAFTVPYSKQNGYDNMIGNITELTKEYRPTEEIPTKNVSLPLPFFFSRDKTVSLPTSSILYNDIRVYFSFRRYDELLILRNAADIHDVKQVTVPTDLATAPQLTNTQAIGEYVVVGQEERKFMERAQGSGCSGKTMVIETVQNTPIHTLTPSTSNSQTIDLRFGNSVKLLLFGSKNVTHKNIHSNYTTSPDYKGVDPMESLSLTYEGSEKFANMPIDYFSLIQPWYYAPTIPKDTGYHMYSYCLDIQDTHPSGSTNFGRLTNVSVTVEHGPKAKTVAAATGNQKQKFEFYCIAVAHALFEVHGGTIRFTANY